MIWNIRKKKHSIRTARGKKNESKKKRTSERSLWGNFKHTNIRIIGVPEGEKKEQEIENLSEKNDERQLP